jgi:multidrug efflux pump subunit AcrA (membrane-fusion protein)
MKRWRLLLAAVVALAVVGGAVVLGLPTLSPKLDRIPTTRATRGDIDVKVHTLGELGPRRSMTLAAPTVGGLLQILTLSPAGTVVKKDDVVIEFDRAEQHYNLQQAESELAEAEQEIAKVEADTKVQISTDKLALLHGQHEVRRAEIDVSGNEFVGRIEAEKNNIKLEESRRALSQLQDDIKTHAVSNKAGRAVLEEKRSKARIAADFARKNIDSMTVRAPLDGLVVIKDNQDASGGFGFPGMTLPEYRPGDTVQPGRTVAEIVDLTEMEIKTKIAETDRAALEGGAAAKVQIEALPRSSMNGASKGLGGLAQNAFWEPQTTRQFEAAFALERPPATLKPGMTARVVVEGGTLKGVTHLPRQVLFEKEGKPIVYVRDGTQFKAVPVKVLRMTENRIVLQDFDANLDVALVNPEKGASGNKSGGGSAPVPGGAR